MSTISIVYDNNSDGVFHSGEQISGTVRYNNQTWKKIYSITLTFEGIAKVEKIFCFKMRFVEVDFRVQTLFF